MPPNRKDDLARRIAAMVAVHEQLCGADQFDRVEVAPYVARLVKKVAEGFRGQVRVETDIAALTLSPDQAMPLGLIVNEVVANAFKHAFSDGANGRLLVSLSVEGKSAQLVVEDDGPGHGTSREKGMGSRLIDGFVGQLGGTVSIDTARGTKVVVSFPVE